MGFPLVASFGWAEIPAGVSDFALPPLVVPNDVFLNGGPMQPRRHLRYLRIYETTVDANADVMSVIADAVRTEKSGKLTAQVDAAQAVMRNEGLVGEWRPSTIEIYKFRSNYREAFLQRVLAHAVWDTELLSLVHSTESFHLSVSNLSGSTRFIWPHFICELCVEERSVHGMRRCRCD